MVHIGSLRQMKDLNQSFRTNHNPRFSCNTKATLFERSHLLYHTMVVHYTNVPRAWLSVDRDTPLILDAICEVTRPKPHGYPTVRDNTVKKEINKIFLWEIHNVTQVLY